MPPAGKIMVKEAGGQKSNTFEKDERYEMIRGAGRIGGVSILKSYSFSKMKSETF